MDPAFPFLLPPELELLVLAYAADRGVVCALLRAACQDGQMHLARRVTDVFDSEAALIDARSALALACGGGHLELARWLAGHFAVTWLGNDHALVGACACGHLPMIRWLSAGFGLTESLIMNTVTAAGNWPVMHWALSCRAPTVGGMQAGAGPMLSYANKAGRSGVARWLLARVNLKARSDILWAPWYACSAGDLGRTRRLAEEFGAGLSGARPGSCIVLNEASIHGCARAVHWLAAHFGLSVTDVRFYSSFILSRAFTGGHHRLARWLTLRFGLTAQDARYLNNSALRFASTNGHCSAVRRLTGDFCLTAEDARAEYNHALRHASVNGHLQTALWLVARFALTAGDTRFFRSGDVLQATRLAGRLGLARWLALRLDLPAKAAPGER